MTTSTKAVRASGPPLSAGAILKTIKSTSSIASATSISSVNSDAQALQTSRVPHILLVTGPAGCGKSTVAEYLAKKLNVPYLEGDKYHPKSNIEKMSNGIPLTDADRWDWLTGLREESLRLIAAGNEAVVVTCSALKRKYRDVIRVAPYFAPKVHLHFIYLHACEAVLLERVRARRGHYMSANMVHSQLDILEPPTPQEIDVISIDVSQPIEDVEAEALAQIQMAIKAEEQ